MQKKNGNRVLCCFFFQLFHILDHDPNACHISHISVFCFNRQRRTPLCNWPTTYQCVNPLWFPTLPTTTMSRLSRCVSVGRCCICVSPQFFQFVKSRKNMVHNCCVVLYCVLCVIGKNFWMAENYKKIKAKYVLHVLSGSSSSFTWMHPATAFMHMWACHGHDITSHVHVINAHVMEMSWTWHHMPCH